MEMTLQQIADRVGGEVHGDGHKKISDAAPFQEATSDQITYGGSQKYLKQIDRVQAGGIIVPRGFEASSKNLIWSDNPKAAFAKILAFFHPKESPKADIHPNSAIGEQVKYGENIFIGPHVSIGDHVVLGDRVCLHAGVAIGHDVTLGDDVILYPNVTIREGCRIGNRVIIHAGTVIGSDGFGFAPDGEAYVKIPQIGIVQIDDDVEIGAVNTIDRAAFGKTWIQQGVKTDNLIQIGHNVTIGKNTIIVAQTGISGSVTVGEHVVIGGQVGVSDHISIGDHAIIGSRGKLSGSVPAGQVISGEQMPHRQWLKVVRTLPWLPELKKKVAKLEKNLSQVLEKLNL